MPRRQVKKTRPSSPRRVRKVAGTAPVYSQPVGVVLREPAPTETVGTGGTPIYGGVVRSAETDSRLVGPLRWKLLDAPLANSATVAASLLFFLNLCGKASWSWPAVDDSPRAQQIADQVALLMGDLGRPWRRVVRGQSMHRLRGFALDEMTAFRRKDGLITARLAQRPQKTIVAWAPSADGMGYSFVVQRSPQDGSLRPIPRWKLLYTVFDAATDSPEGLGVLRQALKSYDALAELEQIEGVGFTTALGGVPKVRAPLGLIDRDTKMTQAKKDAMIAPLEEIISKHVRAVDQGYLLDSETYRSPDGTVISSVPLYDVDVIRGDATGMVPLGAAIERRRHEIAMLFGAEFLFVGASGEGSRALAQQKLASASMLVDGVLADIAEAVDADLLPFLARMNGWPEELVPKSVVDKLTMRDVGEVAAAMRDWAAAGAPLHANDPATNAFRNQLGLPDEPEDTGVAGDAALRGKPGAAPNDPNAAPDPDELPPSGLEG